MRYIPIAKKELKTNKNTVAVTPYVVDRLGAPFSSTSPVDVVPAKTAMETIMPTDPNSMSLRRPVRSIRGRATREAKKYSVPLRAANSRDMVGPNPRLFSKRNPALDVLVLLLDIKTNQTY